MTDSDKSVPIYVEEAIAFYERGAKRHRRAFLLIKGLQILMTASLTIVSLIQKGIVRDNEALIVGAIGALLLVLEGIQQTFQLQPLWVK